VTFEQGFELLMQGFCVGLVVALVAALVRVRG